MSGLEHLREVSKIRKFKKEEIILHEGDTAGEAMYIILLGDAGVYRGYGKPEQIHVSSLKKGDFFGEMSLFLNTRRVASVVALSEITALKIHRDNIAELFGKMPSMAYAIIRTLCTRLQDSNEKYANLFAQLRTNKEQDESLAFQALIEDAPSATPVLLDDAVEENSPTPAVPSPITEPTDTAPVETAPVSAAPVEATPAQVNAYPPNPLFPPGHKHYTLPGMEPDPAIVSNSPCVCPMCDHEFKGQKIRNSKLRLIAMDNDLRSHYQGVEPLYYLTLTCPKCYFSAIRDTFAKAMTNRSTQIAEKINPIKDALPFDFTAPLTADTVFASMYLALQCVPLSYTGRELITARIWRHLSWLYHDCGDEEMEKMATRTAYEQYIAAYESVDIPAASMQSICYIIGDLSFRAEDIRTAKKFYYAARTNRDGGALIRNHAEDRLNELRAWEAEHPSVES